MYPRAEAYIISVKQSTYCQFGEVIRAHTEREKGGEGRDSWPDGSGKRKGRQELDKEARKQMCIDIWKKKSYFSGCGVYMQTLK